MNYTVLNTVPVSGTAPEFFFGDRQGKVVWIEFNEPQGERWYGAFESRKLIENTI